MESRLPLQVPRSSSRSPSPSPSLSSSSAPTTAARPSILLSFFLMPLRRRPVQGLLLITALGASALVLSLHSGWSEQSSRYLDVTAHGRENGWSDGERAQRGSLMRNLTIFGKPTRTFRGACFSPVLRSVSCHLLFGFHHDADGLTIILDASFIYWVFQRTSGPIRNTSLFVLQAYFAEYGEM